MLSGSATMDTAAEPPLAMLHGSLAGAAVVEPLTGLPLDLAAGHLDASADVSATGHSPAAFLATLDGHLKLAATNGALSGFDLSQIDDALARDPSDVALRGALSGGNTGFDRFALTATLQHGNVTLGPTLMDGTSGRVAVAGSVDIAGGAVDLHATLHPAVAGAPILGLLVGGGWARPLRIPELADVTRWRGVQAAK